MEPFDIDKIVKEKLLEDNDRHSQRMGALKPFIWGAVQQKISAKGVMMWYHLAAAIALLMIVFSFVLYSIQQKHNQKMDMLANKLDQIQQNYLSQTEVLHTKNTQAKLLENKLRQIELKLADLQPEQTPAPQEVIVYRTDTVYVKQVEYVTTVADSTHLNKLAANASEGKEASPLPETETDSVIFLSSSSRSSSTEQSGTIKFKFGPFSRED